MKLHLLAWCPKKWDGKVFGSLRFSQRQKFLFGESWKSLSLPTRIYGKKKLLIILVVSFVRVHRNYLSILFGTIGLLKEFGWLLFLMLICLLCLARSTQTVYFFRNWLLRICVKKRSLKSFSCNGGFGPVMYSVWWRTTASIRLVVSLGDLSGI